MSTKRMCALLAGFVSRDRDGHSDDFGAGLTPKEGREGIGPGWVLLLMRRFILEERLTQMAALGDF